MSIKWKNFKVIYRVLKIKIKSSTMVRISFYFFGTIFWLMDQKKK